MLSGEATNTNFIVSWFDPIRARTYDLPHSRRACKDTTVVLRISKDAQTIQWLKEQATKYVYKILNRKQKWSHTNTTNN